MGIERRRKLQVRDAVLLASLAAAQPNAHADTLPDFASGLRESLAATDTIREDRTKAIESLLNTLPQDEKLSHLRDAETLEAESQMYTPSPEETHYVAEAAAEGMATLKGETLENEYGLLGFADMNKSGEEFHRLYVLRNVGGNLQFVKGYQISMSADGFGNEKDSGKTFLGLRHVEYGFEGTLGEVIPVKQDYVHLFKTFIVDKNGRKHHYISTLGKKNITEPATVITDRYTFDPERGIHAHASNRTGRWHIRNGKKEWVSYLGGNRGSGACLRMANVDVRDLGRNYIQLPVREKNKAIKKGTPIYIHASPAVLANHKQKATVKQ